MKQEIEKHIGTLKDGKALGVDNLLVEILKASGRKWWNGSNKRQIINGEDIPEQWKESIIVTIYKEGDITKCPNYRLISRLCHSYKILAKIL